MPFLPSHLWPDTACIDEADHLRIAGCDVPTLAAEHGTPLYLLDEATVRGTMRTYQSAFASAYPSDYRIHYAGKALLNTAIAQIVAQEGLGLDVVSGAELLVARHAGLSMEQIHFHGNAKMRPELERALDWGVGAIVVDNLDELTHLAQLTAGRLRPQGILLRLAPNIDAHTHSYIATGSADSKFGLPLDAVDLAADRIRTAPGLRLLGLHAHIGSQLFDEVGLGATVDVLLDMTSHLRSRWDLNVEEISPGGGLGVPYTEDMPPTDIAGYADFMSRAMEEGCQARRVPLPRLTVEPGRSIIARAGVAVYRIVATKTAPGIRTYLHIDGGMADNIRPALYGTRYTALLANRAGTAPTARFDIAGRYCESGDILLRDAPLPPAGPDDLLAVAVVGAYTLSMASTYNLVPRPPLLLLADGRARVIQRRETEEDVLARDAPYQS